MVMPMKNNLWLWFIHETPWRIAELLLSFVDSEPLDEGSLWLVRGWRESRRFLLILGNQSPLEPRSGCRDPLEPEDLTDRR